MHAVRQCPEEAALAASCVVPHAFVWQAFHSKLVYRTGMNFQSNLQVPKKVSSPMFSQLWQGMCLKLCHINTHTHIQAAIGLSALSSRMLRNPHPELNALPHMWLSALFKRLALRGQTRDDIVRRSAGLPYALAALLQVRCCCWFSWGD